MSSLGVVAGQDDDKSAVTQRQRGGGFGDGPSGHGFSGVIG